VVKFWGWFSVCLRLPNAVIWAGLLVSTIDLCQNYTNKAAFDSPACSTPDKISFFVKAFVPTVHQRGRRYLFL
jgi:uncharacterized protein (UPF0261 family)